MSGELEAAGALATAGAVAGAIEGREPGKPVEGACANCGAKVDGRYCPQCGQAAYAHRSLVHMVGEFLHSLFHFDTKVWRTLPMVILRPGTLTRDYVYGKRARYLSPLALFLLAIFAMFFVFSFVEAPVEVAGTPQEQRAALAEGLTEAREELQQARAALAQEQRELAQRPADAEERGAPRDLGVRLAAQAVELAEADVARRETRLARLDAAIAQASAEAADAAAGDTAPQNAAAPTPAGAPESAATTEADEEIVGVGFEDGETWQDGLRRVAERDDFTVFAGAPALNERVRQNFRNPDLMVYKMQEAASKFSFLLAPLSLPFIWLLFLWKRGVNLYDHVVYALYALAFAAMLFGVVMLAAKSPWTSWLGPWLIMVGLPAHTWFHLKGAYALGWWSATWRTFFMLIFACIILTIFLTGVIFLGLVG
jgi:hypothetical protein